MLQQKDNLRHELDIISLLLTTNKTILIAFKRCTRTSKKKYDRQCKVKNPNIKIEK